MIHTVKQKPTDLVLTIMATNLPEHVTVLKKEKITITQWTFEFSIIGESHVVTVKKHDQLEFHEMLACIRIPEADCLYYYPFNGLEGQSHHQDRYHVEVEFGTLPTWTLPNISVIPHFEVAFPIVWGKTPITRIAWHIDDDTLTWWTLHSYPEHKNTTYVHTKSQFLLT